MSQQTDHLLSLKPLDIFLRCELLLLFGGCSFSSYFGNILLNLWQYGAKRNRQGVSAVVNTKAVPAKGCRLSPCLDWISTISVRAAFNMPCILKKLGVSTEAYQKQTTPGTSLQEYWCVPFELLPPNPLPPPPSWIAGPLLLLLGPFQAGKVTQDTKKIRFANCVSGLYGTNMRNHSWEGLCSFFTSFPCPYNIKS